MQEVWNKIGKQAYFETIHPLIISNLCVSPYKSSTAASVLLIWSSEEHGVPITVHQVWFLIRFKLYNPKHLCQHAGMYSQCHTQIYTRLMSINFSDNFASDPLFWERSMQ